MSADRSASNRDLRIIVLTALATIDIREACLRAGMNGYLLKPVRRDERREALTA
jgi:CheY-like chemotaxis protein